jgi:mono/diheme cytochrome c family protein
MKIFLSLIGVAAVLSSSAARAADASNGEVLAKRWCATCHVVASDQRGPAGDAPPFASVAKRPDFDAHKLAFFLLNPHPKMPDMGLSRREAEDLSAYIATLK